MIYTGENVPRNTVTYANGVRFEPNRVVKVKAGPNGWLEYMPGPPKVKKPEGDCIYTRKLHGNVYLMTPDGEKIIQ